MPKLFRLFANKSLLLIIISLILFSILHFNNDVIRAFLLNHKYYLPYYLHRNIDLVLIHIVTPLKTILFLISLISLGFLSKEEIISLIREIDRNILKRTLIVFVILLVIYFPYSIIIDSMGQEFGRRTISPFTETGGYYFRRLLPLALAYFLHLKGYILYNIFSLLLLYLLVMMTIYFFKRNNTGLTLLEIVSISTCSFISFNFVYLGYTDILLADLILLYLTVKEVYTKTAIIILALTTHETSIFIFLILQFYEFNKKTFLLSLSVILSYVLIMMLPYNFNISELIRSNAITEVSVFDIIKDNILLYFIAVFFSFKLIWVIWLFYMRKLGKDNNWNQFAFSFMSIATGFLLSLLGIDTTRLFGLVFFIFLIAFMEIRNRYKQKTSYKVIVLVNILLPYVYIGLNPVLKSNYLINYFLFDLH